MGSASAWALTDRRASVIAFDRFAPPHALGSTHGHSRIIREAYYEHPLYVPLVRRAYELWNQLASSGTGTYSTEPPLMRITGGLMIGPENGALVSGAAESAR